MVSLTSQIRNRLHPGKRLFKERFWVKKIRHPKKKRQFNSVLLAQLENIIKSGFYNFLKYPEPNQWNWILRVPPTVNPAVRANPCFFFWVPECSFRSWEKNISTQKNQTKALCLGNPNQHLKLIKNFELIAQFEYTHSLEVGPSRSSQAGPLICLKTRVLKLDSCSSWPPWKLAPWPVLVK